jgi:hypothetical protein
MEVRRLLCSDADGMWTGIARAAAVTGIRYNQTGQIGRYNYAREVMSENMAAVWRFQQEDCVA